MGAQGPLIARRRLGGLGLAVALAPFAACRARDRRSILEALVREVVAGMADEMRATSRALHESMQESYEAPAAAHAGSARVALVAALLAWKRASAFRSGPFASSQAFQRAAFWPARPRAIVRVLSATETIDEARVEGLGVDAKGLYALEYLLFDPALAKLLTAEGAEAHRLRRLALEVAKSVRGYAERVARQLGEGGSYARDFAAGGQSSVAGLVAQSVDTLGALRGKLARIPRADALGEPRATAVEGFFSGSSLEVALALLGGAERLYCGGPGGGLALLTDAVSSELDVEVRAGFDDCAARLRALGSPLEVAFDSDKPAYAAAERSIEALEHQIKVNLASALEA